MTAPHSTISVEVSETASLYAIGALDREETAAYEKHLRLGCSVCEAEVRDAAEITARLALTAPIVAAPRDLRDRLAQRIATAEREILVVRADDGEWRATPFPGITIKRLSQDVKANTSTYLVRMSAGSVFIPHNHAEAEQCFMLEGDLNFEDHSLAAGDYELRLPGSKHSSSFTRKGCMLLLVTRMQDELALLGA